MTLGGVVVVLVGIVFANMYLRRSDLKEAAIKLRKQYERDWLKKGADLIDWKDMQKTKGNLRTGPTFAKAILDLEGRPVDIVGFMSPIDQFANVREFMLLPMPTDCYFCESPPVRDIIEVKLEEGKKLVNEPILVGGPLELHKEPNVMFFTTIQSMTYNKTAKDQVLTRKRIAEKHRIELREGFREMREGGPVEVELFDPVAIPELTADEALQAGNEPVAPEGDASSGS